MPPAANSAATRSTTSPTSAPRASRRPGFHSTLRQALGLGLVGGLLIIVLRLTEYRFLVIEHSVEIYVGLVAALFAALGIWLGLRLTSRRTPLAAVAAPSAATFVHSPAGPFASDERQREALGLTPRELEVLALLSEGLSNRQIADRLFVSENTVKTHCSRTFDKLGAARRTQAVQRGRELGLIP